MSESTHARSVELHPAFRFDCDECGRESFVRARVIEFEALDPEERAEIAGEVVDETEGQFLTMPTSVACLHCGAKFEVANQ